MSRYNIKAWSQAGSLRGFSYSPVECTKATTMKALREVPELARQWTDWERIQVFAKLGRGSNAITVNATITNPEQADSFAAKLEDLKT